MYIVIAGAGEVGSYLAKILVDEGHSVAIIERDEKLAHRLDGQLDALVIQGSAVSHEALTRSGVERADLILAVTQIDEVNLVICMAANRLGSSKLRTVARVRDEAYLGTDSFLVAADLGLSLLVGPERSVASEVVGLLHYEGAGNVQELCDEQLIMLELPLSTDSPLVHESLAELHDIFPQPSLVVAVKGTAGLRIPRGTDVIGADERAFILTVPQNANEFWILSGKPWHHVKHALVVGCGTIGFHLATELEALKMAPTILEVDRDRAEWAAKRLDKSIVLCGDGTDPDILREQLDERCDAVVVLIDDDEKSMMIGLLARQLGAKKVIVRSDKPAYSSIANRAGIDALISPKQAVVDDILGYVRRGSILSAHMLGDHEGELLQMKVPANPEHAELLERPLAEIEFPQGALVGAVIRAGRAAIARGDTRLAPGDDLLIIAESSVIKQVERLLAED